MYLSTLPSCPEYRHGRNWALLLQVLLTPAYHEDGTGFSPVISYCVSQVAFKLPESTSGRPEIERRGTDPGKTKATWVSGAKSLRTSAASDQSSPAAEQPPWLVMRTCTPALLVLPASCAGDIEAPKAPPPGTGWQWRCQ